MNKRRSAGVCTPIIGRSQPGVPEQQCSRQQAFMQQALAAGAAAVQVGQHQLQELRPLGDAGLDRRPVGRLDQQRQQLQRPRASRLLRPTTRWQGRVDVVRDAVEPDALSDVGQPRVEVVGDVVAGLRRREPTGKSRPRLAQPAVAVPQFVPHARVRGHRTHGEHMRCSGLRARGLERQRSLRGRLQGSQRRHRAGAAGRGLPAGRRADGCRGRLDGEARRAPRQWLMMAGGGPA
jgi:hypothetical protein